MAAAAQSAIDEDSLSPAELVASFNAAEFLQASRETSSKYNGLVMARALVLVQIRLRCFSVTELARRMGIGRVAVYRWVAAKPMSSGRLERSLKDLAFLLLSEGVDSGHAR
jgi:hypothetical protein